MESKISDNKKWNFKACLKYPQMFAFLHAGEVNDYVSISHKFSKPMRKLIKNKLAKELSYQTDVPHNAEFDFVAGFAPSLVNGKLRRFAMLWEFLGYGDRWEWAEIGGEKFKIEMYFAKKDAACGAALVKKIPVIFFANPVEYDVYLKGITISTTQRIEAQFIGKHAHC